MNGLLCFCEEVEEMGPLSVLGLVPIIPANKSEYRISLESWDGKMQAT